MQIRCKHGNIIRYGLVTAEELPTNEAIDVAIEYLSTNCCTEEEAHEQAATHARSRGITFMK